MNTNKNTSPILTAEDFKEAITALENLKPKLQQKIMSVNTSAQRRRFARGMLQQVKVLLLDIEEVQNFK